ncbi:EAL domain-containing protein, partial [Pontibacterium sp.]|uniref:EAL domain-containing protein n=1 Tax=Pontibacterium sp. TaxID=2036026 RepID=UPI003562954C
GIILPDQFIPLAEQSGLITSLGEWVFQTGLKQAAQMQRHFGARFYTAFNLSMAQFVSCSHIGWLIDKLGSSNANITIELTESLKFIDNAEYRSILDSIKKSGCKIALDDFGTGQSSLSYIKQVPVDIVKIDRSFVRDISIDHNDSELVLAIIQMAKAFNLTTIAEGVETYEQLDFLKAHGCQYAQGFLFGKALPFNEFLKFSESFGFQEMVFE